jgi:hypothetical protein
MRFTTLLACGLLGLLTAACSGVEIQPDPVDTFSAGNYTYYTWRTEPLPANAGSSDPFYKIDPAIRREVNRRLQEKGYVLDHQRAQFTVDYMFATELREGAQSDQATNITPYPRVVPNRRVDGASVDNAIALGGVKETNNIVIQFNDRTSNKAVWQVTMTKFVEDSNQVDNSRLKQNMEKFVERALKPLPPQGAN